MRLAIPLRAAVLAAAASIAVAAPAAAQSTPQPIEPQPPQPITPQPPQPITPQPPQPIEPQPPQPLSPPQPASLTPATKPADPIPGNPKKARDEQHVQVDLASYNINLIYRTQWKMPDKDRAAQAGAVIEYFSPDVVVIDEAFKPEADQMLDDLVTAGYKYRTPVVGRECSGDGWDGTYGDCSSIVDVIRGGTVILSKWPILKQYQYIYENSVTWSFDFHANKGVALVQIQAPGGGKFWVAGTHLQASDSDVDPQWGFPWGKYEEVRDKQLQELGQFIEQRADWTDEVVLIAGDLNIPVYHDKLVDPLDPQAHRPDHLLPDGGGQVFYNNGDLTLKLLTPLINSPGGVSVDCVSNKTACDSQNAAAAYPPRYQDSLDYIGFLDEWGRPLPLDMTPPVTEFNAAWKAGAGYSPSDHYPVMATFTLAFDEDDASNGSGAKKAGGNKKGGGKKARGNTKRS